MSKTSAGLLLFRDVAGTIEVLIVHPGGPFWATQDQGAWSIPKGEISDDEDRMHAALREFKEEMGEAVTGDFVALQPRRQAGGNVVYAWAVKSDFDPTRLRSNTFSMEWPPRSGLQQVFPEIDRTAWFPVHVARIKILKGQVGFLDELQGKLSDLQFHRAIFQR
jgi:predicted NUDIX family NTP pyrophosphohydrolase